MPSTSAPTPNRPGISHVLSCSRSRRISWRCRGDRRCRCGRSGNGSVRATTRKRRSWPRGGRSWSGYHEPSRPADSSRPTRPSGAGPVPSPHDQGSTGCVLALGRLPGRLRARRRRHLRRDHRRPALPRRPQRGPAPHDAVRLQGPERRAHPGHPRDAREAAPQAPRRARAATTSAASTTTSPRSCATSSTWSATRSTRWPRGPRGRRGRRPAPPGDHRAGRRASASCSSTCSRPTWPAWSRTSRTTSSPPARPARSSRSCSTSSASSSRRATSTRCPGP